jgi:hypothetical protein
MQRDIRFISSAGRKGRLWMVREGWKIPHKVAVDEKERPVKHPEIQKVSGDESEDLSIG